MDHRAINKTGISYSQAYEINNPKRMLFISGQIPEGPDGKIPPDFRSQCLLTWKNIELQLKAADMDFNNLVKVTVYLSDRRYREENYKIRTEVLGEHSPALTIIITGIYDENWLLEIEALAAD